MTHNSKDEDEQLLFREHMKEVIPLKKSAKIARCIEKPPVLKTQSLLKAATHVKTVLIKNYALSDPFVLDIQAEQSLSHYTPGLPSKRVKMLKKGDFTLDARLDLHGLNLETARERLAAFIENSVTKGYRLVLVIHGKGGQHGNVAILKSHVAHWLKQFPQILGFQSAQARHGGTGATYLLLKKQR
jgi:DNA-nicking Smr family endonuclease